MRSQQVLSEQAPVMSYLPKLARVTSLHIIMTCANDDALKDKDKEDKDKEDKDNEDKDNEDKDNEDKDKDKEDKRINIRKIRR